MIEANISIVRSRIGDVNNTLGGIATYLDKYQRVNEFVTLTAGQKSAALATYTTQMEAVAAAWNSLVEAENATEPIAENATEPIIE